MQARAKEVWRLQNHLEGKRFAVRVGGGEDGLMRSCGRFNAAG
jgi:hypothetical protein